MRNLAIPLMKLSVWAILLVTFQSVRVLGQPPAVKPKACAACIRAHEEFLASDAMQGRSSGTHDELVTATYIASELRQYGVEPAGDSGSGPIRR
jgi:hypothetical protein